MMVLPFRLRPAEDSLPDASGWDPSGREFIQEKHWCVDHKHFRDLNAAAEPPLKSCTFAVDFRAELKFFDQGIARRAAAALSNP